MMHDTNRVAASLIGLILATTGWVALADVSANPYRNIVANNVFRLKPVEVRTEEQAPRPAARIRLAGITTILSRKVAILNLQLPATPSEPATQFSCTLAEGQREGEITVLTIDEKAGRVKVNNYGTEMVLSFDTDNPPLPNTAPPNHPPIRLPQRVALKAR
jgi:hypothetical protein